MESDLPVTQSQPRRNPLARLHSKMQEYVDRGEVPGLVYLVEHNDDISIEPIGRRSIDGPDMTRDTIFRIASMTKPIIAVATMILVEEGRIELDQPVDQVLPELADRQVLRSIAAQLDDTIPARRPITVDDLLTFRLGIGVIPAPPGSFPVQKAMDELKLGQGPPNPSGIPDPDEWMRRLGSIPLIHHPGEHWMYNTGSDVLGVLVSRVAGKPLEEFLRERIFDLLGMNDTGFSVPDRQIDRLATSYGIDPETGAFTVYDPARGGQWSRSPAFQSGASGLVSTVDDYHAFARMLLNEGEYQQRHILTRPSVELLTTNQLTPGQRQGGEPILDDTMGWGFGLAVVTSPGAIPCSAGTYGWNGGLGTTWSSDPVQKTNLVLLTQVNWTSPRFPSISRDFLSAAFHAIKR